MGRLSLRPIYATKPELEIEKIKAEKWNGQLPVYNMGAQGHNPIMFNVPAGKL